MVSVELKNQRTQGNQVRDVERQVVVEAREKDAEGQILGDDAVIGDEISGWAMGKDG